MRRVDARVLVAAVAVLVCAGPPSADARSRSGSGSGRPGRPGRSGRIVQLRDISRARVDPQLRREVLERLATVLESRRGWRVLRPTSPAAASRAEIDRLLAEASTHSERFKEQQARQALARAEGVFRGAYGAAVSLAPLIQILEARAKLHTDLGDMAAARADLARLIAVAPDHELDRGVFTPDLVRAHRKLARKRRQRRGTIRVVTSPPGVEVWVDGRLVGRAPQSVGVVAGEHFVAAGPVGGRSSDAVMVVEGDAKSVSLQLPRHRPPSDTELRAAGKRAGARWVAAVTLSQRLGEDDRFRLRVRLLSCVTLEVPRLFKSAEVNGAGLPAATAELAAKLKRATRPAPPRVVAKPRPAPAPRPPPVIEKKRSILATWWFWTAVAVAVGGGTAAAVLLTRDDDPGVRLRLER